MFNSSTHSQFITF